MPREKKWPIDLIRRGQRMEPGANKEIIWWQEPEKANGNSAPIAITSAAAARSIGYEAHSFTPIAYPEKLATTIEEFLQGRIDASDLKAAVDSYRSFVQKPENKPRGQ